MGIVRGHFNFEDNYTLLPNEWIRNKDLSLKARGLLAELMSHREGWQTTVAGLESAKDGEAAVRSGIVELEQAGLLERKSRNEGGRIVWDWILHDSEGSRHETPGEPTCDYPVPGNPVLENRGTSKKTNSKEDYLLNTSPIQDQAGPGRYSEDFEVWWKSFPKAPGRTPASKSAAWSQYKRIVKQCGDAHLLAQLEAYVPTVESMKYIKNPDKWLKEGLWEVEYEHVVNPLDEAVANRDFQSVELLTGVRFREPDNLVSLPLSERSVARVKAFDVWAVENRDRLVAGWRSKALAAPV